MGARSRSEDGNDEVVQEAAEHAERASQERREMVRTAVLEALLRVLASVASLARVLLTVRLQSATRPRRLTALTTRTATDRAPCVR